MTFLRITLAVLFAVLAVAFGFAAQDLAKGVVFHDRDGDRARDPGEEGLKGIRVSNQREVTVTDANGEWRLPYDDDTTFFVIKPRDWTTPFNEDNMPVFYYRHKPNGSPKLRFPGVAPTGPLPESIDFPLYPSPEPERFTALFFGDSQPYSIDEVDYLGHDVVEELIGSKERFGVTLGDIVGDNPDLFEPLTGVVGRVGIPWYYVIGNHDTNYDSMDDEHSDESFERHFGPNYYSFEYGSAHLVVMDDIHWSRRTADDAGRYTAQFGKEQIEFLRNDLALVPQDRLVVLMMHIPIYGCSDREEVFRLLEKRPHTLSISAHTHTQEHHFLTEAEGWRGKQPHHHLVNVTSCGSWWRGAPDEVGIPHTMMRDGAPNGYSILTFDGSDYSVEYRASRRPASYQMNVWLPNEIAREAAAETKVYVNVFGGSERSTVEMRFGEKGVWVPLERVNEPDPYYAALKASETSEKPPNGRTLPDAGPSTHLWTGKLPPFPGPGTHTLHVRTTDMFGHVYYATRVVRVK